MHDADVDRPVVDGEVFRQVRQAIGSSVHWGLQLGFVSRHGPANSRANGASGGALDEAPA